MTAEIVDFSTRRRKNASAPLTEKQRELDNSVRVQQILSTMKMFPVMKAAREGDQVDWRQVRRRVANNMWRILESLESLSPPIKKKDVLHKAKLGSEGDSTKRLPSYAIDPSLPEDTQDTRANNVTQKIDKYVNLARAAASLGRCDADHFIPVLVEGTPYAALPTEGNINAADQPADIWKEVLAMIEAAVRRIGDKYKLRDLFQDITSAGIAWRQNPFSELDLIVETGMIWGKHMNFSPQDETGRHRGYESLQLAPRPLLVSDTDLPPRPSLFLGTTRVSALPFSCDLNFSLKPFNEEELQYPYDLLANSGLASGSLKGNLVAELLVFLELLPYGRKGDIAPHLRFKAKTTFYAAEDYRAFSLMEYAKRKHLTLPDPIKAGDVLGYSWQCVESSTPMTDNDRLAVVLLDDLAEDWIELAIEAKLKYSLSAPYTHSIHARIPKSGGSYIVPLDVYAIQYLGDEVSHTDRENPCCFEVEQGLDTSTTDDDACPFFANRSMLAAVKRSLLSPGLGDSRLDRLLEKKVKAYVDTATSELARHQSNDAAGKQHKAAALAKFMEQRDAFMREY